MKEMYVFCLSAVYLVQLSQFLHYPGDSEVRLIEGSSGLDFKKDRFSNMFLLGLIPQKSSIADLLRTSSNQVLMLLHPATLSFLVIQLLSFLVIQLLSFLVMQLCRF